MEYPKKLVGKEKFYNQNISACLEISDVHIYNPEIDNNKYYFLTEQIIKYVVLMMHPGLITPTHIERCMQIAYNAKVNSGCLSRQVGAVITGDDYSIKSVGWNEVPKGHLSCGLRDVRQYCRNKDEESYSHFEITDCDFSEAITEIYESIDYEKLGGRLYPYCFKDIYNEMKDKDNQVHTRALHAEENAFLQISKYGGEGVQGGYLFITASPCELCAKKSYQIGIKKIFYIDPYPGISQNHILKFGSENNPEMLLFFGAIGNAYISLYTQRISIKDELEMITGIKPEMIIKELNYDEKKILVLIDRAIKEVWLNEVKADIENSYVLYEDTLKNVFYYHLRNKLNQLLANHNIRIFTEFHDGKLAGKGVKADIAIVKICDNEVQHIKENIEKIYAVIELKHKSSQVPVDCFIKDIEKTIGYIKDKELTGCQFYLGFIHEGEFDANEVSWIQNKRQERLTAGRLTELSACYYTGQDKMVYTVLSYNDMNTDIK